MRTNILLKPVLTEKSMKQASSGWYTFIVDRKTNKYQIAQAVNQQFNVHVRKARTLVIKGGTKRSLRKRGLVTKIPDYKKALLKLKQDEKIGLFAAEQPAKIK